MCVFIQTDYHQFQIYFPFLCISLEKMEPNKNDVSGNFKKRINRKKLYYLLQVYTFTKFTPYLKYMDLT